MAAVNFIPDYANNRNGKCFVLKNKKRDENFPQKTLRCFSNSTERSKACSSINKTIIFGKGDTKSGRLKNLTSDLELVEIVEGCKIPLIEFSSQEGLPKQLLMTKRQEDLVKLEIQEMLGKGANRPVLPIKDQFVSNVFLVDRKDGGNRPVTKNFKSVHQAIKSSSISFMSLVYQGHN